jgi:hypothetical protein
MDSYCNRNSKYHFESKNEEEDTTYGRSRSSFKKRMKIRKVMILSESDSDDHELEEDNFVIPCNMKMSSAILLEGKAGKDVYQFTSGMLIMIYLIFRHSDTAICKHHPWYSVRSW